MYTFGMGELPFERRRWSVVVCPQEGKAHVIDMFAERLKLMRLRIMSWAEITEQLRREIQEKGGSTRMVMILLTYRRVIDYKPGHIREYMKALKQSLGDGLLSFAWVAELQKRGAVHYHLIIVVRKGTRIPLPDKSGMWKHGLSGIHTARTPFYLVKYTGKEYQKDLSRYPKSCRLYSASLRSLSVTYRDIFRSRSGLVKYAPDANSPKWEFAGSSVTEDYAREIIVPADYVVK